MQDIHVVVTQDYFIDTETGIRIRKNARAFNYSDGDQIEERLWSAIKTAQDRSSYSSELRRAITDWPSEYHFSPKRRNLLLPLNLTAKSSILELGCGCGAITRHLGETGARVVAVEGSLRRASIAAERCRDLANVTIYCDDLNNFVTEEKFDFVTLIGVLEYARQFSSSANPQEDCLRQCGQWLLPSGHLILAIENQLGLKYFNGCAEDHLGTPYSGIENCYGPRTPATHGKKALYTLLQAAGFDAVQFLYPFPDYKLPELILTESALRDPDLNIGDLLCRMESRDYAGLNFRNFRENRVWSLLSQNGLLGDLANSVLVLASKTYESATCLIPEHFLAVSYALDRAPGLATETTFTRTSSMRIEVNKNPLKPHCDSQPESNRFTHIVRQATHIPGRLLLAMIQDAFAQTASVATIATTLSPWITILERSRGEHDSIDGKLLDCIPRNIIIAPDGEPHLIDAEWVSNSQVSRKWLIIRGLADCIISSKIPEPLCYHTAGSLIQAIAQALDIDLSSEDILLACEEESRFQAWANPLGNTKGLSYLIPILLSTFNLPELAQQLNLQKKEITRIKSTVSWHITKPLRSIDHLWRKITHIVRRIYCTTKHKPIN